MSENSTDNCTGGSERSDCPLCGGAGFVTAETAPDTEAKCLTDDCQVKIFEVLQR